METMFDHEKLDVYHVARQFNREVHVLLMAMRGGYGDSRDNLSRGAMSITRNIAEGSGKWSIRDKIRFYHIARGSATECAACLDELVDFELIAADRVVAPKQTLARVIAMLTAMIKSIEARDSRQMLPHQP